MAIALEGPVGNRNLKTPVENRVTDQARVATLLTLIPPDKGGKKGIWPVPPVPRPKGQCAPELAKAIWDFQGFWRSRGQPLTQDGVVDRNGRTIAKLNELAPSTASVLPLTQSVSGLAIQQTNGPDLAEEHSDEYPVLSPLSAGGKFHTFPVAPTYRNLLFRVEKGGRVFWIGAAVPKGTADFTKVQVYLHPSVVNSGTVHARDADYPTFTGGWSERLKRYTRIAGLQIAAARLVTVLVPFTTMAARAGGPANMFHSGGLNLINEVMAAVQAICTPANKVALGVTAIGVTSFSNGIDSLKLFLADLGSSGLIREIIDLDSPFITSYPKRLTRLKGAVSRCFAQVPPAAPEFGYVFMRPEGFPASMGPVHGQIGWMMYYSAMLTSVIV